MAYRIQIVPPALKALADLPQKIQRQLIKKIDALFENPLPPGHKKLHTQKPFYRIRSGDYRIVYSIDNNQITILILRIAHRRNIYKNLQYESPDSLGNIQMAVHNTLKSAYRSLLLHFNADRFQYLYANRRFRNTFNLFRRKRIALTTFD